MSSDRSEAGVAKTPAPLGAGLAVLALFTLTLACGSSDSLPDPLAGSSWRATDYADPADPLGMISALSGAAPTLTFGRDGAVRGSGGCNTFRGPYGLFGDSLTFGPLASTMMYCGDREGIMDQEATFLRALEFSMGFELDGGELRILDLEGAVLVSLRPVSEGSG